MTLERSESKRKTMTKFQILGSVLREIPIAQEWLDSKKSTATNEFPLVISTQGTKPMFIKYETLTRTFIA